jgi:hypothetical protein
MLGQFLFEFAVAVGSYGVPALDGVDLFSSVSPQGHFVILANCTA